MSVNCGFLYSLKDSQEIRRELGVAINAVLNGPLDQAEPYLKELFAYYAQTQGKPENYLAALALRKIQKYLPPKFLSENREDIIQEAGNVHKDEIIVHLVCGNIFGLQDTDQSIGTYQGLNKKTTSDLLDVVMNALDEIDFKDLLSREELQFMRTVFNGTNLQIGLVATGYSGQQNGVAHRAYVVYTKSEQGGYYIVCNRGRGGKRTIDAYLVHKPVEQVVERLKELRETGSPQAFKQQVYTLIPQELQGEKNRFTERLQRLSPKFQKTGNCAWASLKTAFRAVAILTRIHFKGGQSENDLIDVIEAAKLVSTNVREQFLQYYLEDDRFKTGSVYRDDYMISKMQANIRKRKRAEFCVKHGWTAFACAFAVGVFSMLGTILYRMN